MPLLALVPTSRMLNEMDFAMASNLAYLSKLRSLPILCIKVTLCASNEELALFCGRHLNILFSYVSDSYFLDVAQEFNHVKIREVSRGLRNTSLLRGSGRGL